MTPETVIDIGRAALMTTILVAAPMLLMALGVGLVIGVFQAATQIQEATLSFIPKLFAVLITLGLAGPWMLMRLVDYVHRLFDQIPLLLT